MRRLLDLEALLGSVKLGSEPHLPPLNLKRHERFGQRLIFDLAVTPRPGHCLIRIGLTSFPLATVHIGGSAQQQFDLLSL